MFLLGRSHDGGVETAFDKSSRSPPRRIGFVYVLEVVGILQYSMSKENQVTGDRKKRLRSRNEDEDGNSSQAKPAELELIEGHGRSEGSSPALAGR